MKKKRVMISGGFDPVHAGHVSMVRHAAKLGKVIVVVNSDNWLHFTDLTVSPCPQAQVSATPPPPRVLAIEGSHCPALAPFRAGSHSAPLAWRESGPEGEECPEGVIQLPCEFGEP